MFNVTKYMHFLHAVCKQSEAIEATSPCFFTMHKLQDISLEH